MDTFLSFFSKQTFPEGQDRIRIARFLFMSRSARCLNLHCARRLFVFGNEGEEQEGGYRVGGGEEW